MKPQPETLSVVFPGVEVRVPLKEKYVFPENCVVCGKKPAEKEVYQTIMQMGNPNRFATAGWFEINFPICNACSQIQETARRKSQSFFLPSALTGVGTFVLVLLLTRFNIIAALIAGCFLTIIGIIVYSWLVDRKISKEFLNQYQKIRMSVRVTGVEVSWQPVDSYVKIKFASEDYARKFVSLNKGEFN